MRYLENFLPAHDKLKHFFIGALVFVFLSLFLSDLLSIAIVLVGACLGELWQKLNGGTNNKKEMALDIFYGVLLGLLINLVNVI